MKRLNLDNAAEIHAGPCSVGTNSRRQLEQIAAMRVRYPDGQTEFGVFGERIVGLKSRTSYKGIPEYMGMDHNQIISAMRRRGNIEDIDLPPSVQLARDMVKDMGVVVVTELMEPAIQMAFYEKAGIPHGHLIGWNPSVMHLGWPVGYAAILAEQIGYGVAIKNGKNKNGAESSWMGLANYALGVTNLPEITLIHRGFDTAQNGDYRSPPDHEIARRAKTNLQDKYPGRRIKLLFDPSHSYGPKLKNQIPQAIIDTLLMNTGNNSHYLYDGILVEAGDSTTDTDQHITINDLEVTLQEVVNQGRVLRPHKNV